VIRGQVYTFHKKCTEAHSKDANKTDKAKALFTGMNRINRMISGDIYGGQARVSDLNP